MSPRLFPPAKLELSVSYNSCSLTHQCYTSWLKVSRSVGRSGRSVCLTRTRWFAAVLMGELVKLFTCLAILPYSEGSVEGAWNAIKTQILNSKIDTLKVGVPSPHLHRSEQPAVCGCFKLGRCYLPGECVGAFWEQNELNLVKNMDFGGFDRSGCSGKYVYFNLVPHGRGSISPPFVYWRYPLKLKGVCLLHLSSENIFPVLTRDLLGGGALNAPTFSAES